MTMQRGSVRLYVNIGVVGVENDKSQGYTPITQKIMLYGIITRCYETLGCFDQRIS